MTARWTAFGLWAAVAASLGYWGLKLFVTPAPAPAGVTVASTAFVPPSDLTRLLGVDAPVVAEPPPPPVSRFQLIGVVAPRGAGAAREGVALIAVDDKPARAYRVGAVVDGETVLQAVHARGASLGPRGGTVNVALDIPPPPAATTGVLPPAGLPGMPQTVAPPNLPQVAPPIVAPGAARLPPGMRGLQAAGALGRPAAAPLTQQPAADPPAPAPESAPPRGNMLPAQ